MKLALGMLAHNDAFLLPRILPLLMPHFELTIVGYHPGTDSTLEILQKTEAVIAEIKWTWDWAAARNTVIALAQARGFTHMLMLDSDELMLESDLKTIANDFTIGSRPQPYSVRYPRYEFVDDFDHYDPSLYPDFQARGFPLNCGFGYVGSIHEQLTYKGEIASKVGMCWKSKRHIFHYGKCKPKAEVALKYHNYDRFNQEMAPVETLPDDYKLPETWAPGTKKKFEGEKSL